MEIIPIYIPCNRYVVSKMRLFENAAVLHNNILFLKKIDLCYAKKNTKLKLASFNKQYIKTTSDFYI